jgi:hypothetical protein
MKDPRISKLGVSGYNKPKKTPNHPTKSHVVLAKVGDEIKTVRFGQQGVTGAGSNPKTAKDKARKKSYYARHNAQDANPSKLSARYWSHKVKWTIILSGSILLMSSNNSLENTYAEWQPENRSHVSAVQAV